MRISWMTWHRRIGIGAAVLVLLATVTGILINHADGLGLARKQVTSPAVLRWWGMTAPALQLSCVHNERWLSAWGTQLFVDDRPVPVLQVEAPVGCRGDGKLWLIADRRQLIVLQADGGLVEQLPYPSGFVALRAAERESGSSWLIASTDQRWIEIDATGSEFKPLPGAPSTMRTMVPSALPEALQRSIEVSAKHTGLSFERVLLDVHSGRWLGRGGVWLMDAAAIALLVLAATGLWTVWQRSRVSKRLPR